MEPEEQRMITRYPKTVAADGPGKEKKAAEGQAKTGTDDACRCKEASKMTPRELLGLMLTDLAFWKKAKK
jgi:hypothetical protein